MKYKPLFDKGQRVQYNSLLCAGATHGTILSVNNDKEPHEYTIEPDLFKGKSEVVIVRDIQNKI